MYIIWKAASTFSILLSFTLLLFLLTFMNCHGKLLCALYTRLYARMFECLCSIILVRYTCVCGVKHKNIFKTFDAVSIKRSTCIIYVHFFLLAVQHVCGYV